MPHPQLHLIAPKVHVDMKVDMGDGPATPSAGFAGWEEISRVRRRAMTDFAGLPAFQQTVPILFDGFDEDASVERAVENLLKLGGGVVFKAFGPIWFPGSQYVFGAEPEFGTTPGTDVIRSEGGTLLRQRMTLTLMGYVPPDQAGKRIKPKAAVGTAVPLTYRTKKGDTLNKIAVRIYHDHTRWKEIGSLNGIKDPFRKLKPNRVLKLPQDD